MSKPFITIMTVAKMFGAFTPQPETVLKYLHKLAESSEVPQDIRTVITTATPKRKH